MRLATSCVFLLRRPPAPRATLYVANPPALRQGVNVPAPPMKDKDAKQVQARASVNGTGPGDSSAIDTVCAAFLAFA